ncbi:MAG: hypothetical protein WBA00_06880, partial [Rhodococcus sp. (in: high G+C Gram-positive bacteria)]
MRTLITKLRSNSLVSNALVWAIPLGAVIGAILAMMFTATLPKSYTASTVLFIGSPAAGDSAGAYQGDLFSQQRAGTYAQLFSGDDLAVKVNDDLSLGLTPTELASKVTATAVEKTVLLQVDVTDSTPTGAADIANAYADNFAQFIGQLENPTGGGQPSSLVTVIRTAEPPAVPTSPSSSTNTAAGVVLGGGIAFLIVWVRRRFDKRVRTVDALAAASGATVLGTLPGDAARAQTILSLPADSTDTYTEGARKLRTTVQFVDLSKQKESLLVTGIGDGAASREVAANLALLLTETGRTVVLVDADLRGSRMSDYVGSDASGSGLTDVLRGAVMVEDAVVEIADGRLSFLPSGGAGDTPGEEIASNLMRTVLAELARTYDHVVLSAPDAVEFADAAVLSHDVDGTILVVRRGASTAAEVSTGARAVQSTGGRLYGTVLVDGSSGKMQARLSATPAKAPKASKAPRVTKAPKAPVSPTSVVTTTQSEPAATPVEPQEITVLTDQNVDGFHGNSIRSDRFEEDRFRDAHFGDAHFGDARFGDARFGDARFRDDRFRDDLNRDDLNRDDFDRGGLDRRSHDSRVDADSSKDAATDQFPVVSPDERFKAFDAGWAPAAPIRRPVPARPFPRAAVHGNA